MLSIELIICCVLGLTAPESGSSADGGGEKITIKFNDVPLHAALDTLVSRFRVPLLFLDADVEGIRISARCAGCSGEQAIDALLKPTNLFWRSVGSEYVISKRRPVGPDAMVTVSGTIVDSLTGRPLENAIAFLAGTTAGTNSDTAGGFLLRTHQAGQQDLVISLVGFERKVFRLHLLGGDSTYRHIALTPRLLPQDPVEVTGSDAKEWRANLTMFEKVVRGWGEFAGQCRLLNPYVVRLTLRGDTLLAGCDSLLWVENPALGYDMGVVIRDFDWDVNRNEGVWSVYVFFRQMRPASPEQRSLWSEHRESAYRGSMRHFLWALVHRRVFEEGFEMRVGKWSDSRMWKLIGEDSIHLELYPGTHLLEWTYPGMIRVDYNPQVYPPSFFRLADEFSLVDSSGVVVTPLAYELGGKWGWESMGRMLPADYSPEDLR